MGSTTNSVTKGLNIWGSPRTLLDEKGEKIDYLLIDSEGIGSSFDHDKPKQSTDHLKYVPVIIL